MREPGRRREALTVARLKVENQMRSLLVRFGVADFRPRLKTAPEQVEKLRTIDGRPLPPNTKASLDRLMAQHRLLSEQLKEIETARERVIAVADPDRIERMIQALARLVGVGVETAATLVHEVFSRRFREREGAGRLCRHDRRASRQRRVEARAGPQAKNGNPRVRRMLMQATWRWLIFQPQSALAQWFFARTAGAKGRMKKIMAVALARKLLVALWRTAETGVVPDGARLAAA